VGIIDAKSKIQIDRYSAISPAGVAVSFLNETNTRDGWKISLNGANTWARFDRVDFGKNSLRSVNVRADSSTGGTVEIHLDQASGPLVAKIEIGKGSDWGVIQSRLATVPAGLHDLVVTHNEDNGVDLDWISFE
jgi:hypothetical protein